MYILVHRLPIVLVIPDGHLSLQYTCYRHGRL